MKSPKISIVVPVYNEESNVKVLYDAVTSTLLENNLELLEIIFVNDGSSDASIFAIKTLAQSDIRVKFIHFSKNFGHQQALRAGLIHSSGEVVISMDGDMQHPPSMLPDFISKWQEGYDVVNTIRQEDNNLSFFKRLTSRLFYRLVNSLSSEKIEEGTADFRLIDRKVIEVLKTFEEENLFLRGIIPNLGFKQTALPYSPNKRHSGVTKYTFSKMLNLAINGITSSSAKPLYLSIYIGFFFSFLSFSYAVYAIGISIFTEKAIQGWTSIIASILFIGGIQLIMIGIIGVYLGKLFMENKKRPSFIVAETNLEKE